MKIVRGSPGYMFVSSMMYWTDKGESPRIEKASMNGNDRSLVIDFEFRAVPVGLAIDSNG